VVFSFLEAIPCNYFRLRPRVRRAYQRNNDEPPGTFATKNKQVAGKLASEGKFSVRGKAGDFSARPVSLTFMMKRALKDHRAESQLRKRDLAPFTITINTWRKPWN
jgi:hypothetical protein